MSILQMSLAGAVLVLLAVLIRAVAVNALPKRTFLVLWWIVLLRLLVPVSLSLPTFKAEKTEAPVLGGIGDVIEETKDFFLDVEDIVTGSVQTPDLEPAPAETEPQTRVPIFVLLWAAGAVIAAGAFAVLYLRCVREFRASLPVENEFLDGWLRDHRLRRRLEVRALSGLSTPLTYGLFRPVILVPADMDWWDTKTAGYVLYHEYVHIRRLDTLTKLLTALALCLHWFNPTVWVFYVLFNRDLELACDERVLRHFGRDKRADYALTLIDLEERRVSPTPLHSYFAKNATEERIRAIMKTKRTTIFAVVIAVLIVTLAITAVAVFSPEKAPDPEKAETVGFSSFGVYKFSKMIAGYDMETVEKNFIFVFTPHMATKTKLWSYDYDDWKMRDTTTDIYALSDSEIYREDTTFDPSTFFENLGFTDEPIFTDIDLTKADFKAYYTNEEHPYTYLFEVNGKLWYYEYVMSTFPFRILYELEPVSEEELESLSQEYFDGMSVEEGVEKSIRDNIAYQASFDD